MGVKNLLSLRWKGSPCKEHPKLGFLKCHLKALIFCHPKDLGQSSVTHGSPSTMYVLPSTT